MNIYEVPNLIISPKRKIYRRFGCCHVSRWSVLPCQSAVSAVVSVGSQCCHVSWRSVLSCQSAVVRLHLGTALIKTFAFAFCPSCHVSRQSVHIMSVGSQCCHVSRRSVLSCQSAVSAVMSVGSHISRHSVLSCHSAVSVVMSISSQCISCQSAVSAVMSVGSQCCHVSRQSVHIMSVGSQ